MERNLLSGGLQSCTLLSPTDLVWGVGVGLSLPGKIDSVWDKREGITRCGFLKRID